MALARESGASYQVEATLNNGSYDMTWPIGFAESQLSRVPVAAYARDPFICRVQQ